MRPQFNTQSEQTIIPLEARTGGTDLAKCFDSPTESQLFYPLRDLNISEMQEVTQDADDTLVSIGPGYNYDTSAYYCTLLLLVSCLQTPISTVLDLEAEQFYWH